MARPARPTIAARHRVQAALARPGPGASVLRAQVALRRRGHRMAQHMAGRNMAVLGNTFPRIVAQSIPTVDVRRRVVPAHARAATSKAASLGSNGNWEPCSGSCKRCGNLGRPALSDPKADRRPAVAPLVVPRKARLPAVVPTPVVPMIAARPRVAALAPDVLLGRRPAVVPKAVVPKAVVLARVVRRMARPRVVVPTPVVLRGVVLRGVVLGQVVRPQVAAVRLQVLRKAVVPRGEVLPVNVVGRNAARRVTTGRNALA